VNALERPVAARVPPVRAALAALSTLGSPAVAMSGSGSTCFALAPNRATAEAWADALGRAHPDCWVRAAAFGAVSRP
jgi:4-diphosphocytidyl-2-C-methyl-D-erythritol kinase